jgi:hypothetical protein
MLRIQHTARTHLFPSSTRTLFFGSSLDMKIAWKIKKIKERQYVTKRANLLAKKLSLQVRA